MSECATRWRRTSMHVEAMSAPAPPQAPALTRRASLNAVQALLDYGAWEMLSRLISYMTAADARPTEALRLVVATRQGLNDPTGDRRAVGSALVVWLIFLPLVVLV